MTQTIEELRTEALAVAQAMVDDMQATIDKHKPLIETAANKVVDSNIPDAIKVAILNEMSKLSESLQT